MLPKLLAEIVAAEQAKLWRSSVKLAIMMSLLGLAVMAVVVGMVFMLYGLFLSLTETFPPWQAGVIVGGVVVFFAAILLMVIAQQSRAVPLKSNNLPEQTADDPTAQLGTVIGDIVAKSNVKSSDFVLTALIAGIVLGASPSLRQRILTTLSDMTKSNDK
ncbi:MAG: phage holin family protein [Nitrosomonas sp.]|uniref:phage holin family protein n=1 Tax=Nitrosomonas sp. TaxID=42353 RepID=UPI0027310402|nr:phage holin family protein [Nitrosomonas sp.]MDP1548637.1 phage holin family protein [Nitrosomonas sp.]MDP3281443.1 phage holin family protein [Nitrosomonas sp.]